MRGGLPEPRGDGPSAAGPEEDDRQPARDGRLRHGCWWWILARGFGTQEDGHVVVDDVVVDSSK